MNTLTNYQQFQLQRYGNILDENGFLKDISVNRQEAEDLENGYNEAAAFAAWDQQQHDKQQSEFETWK